MALIFERKREKYNDDLLNDLVSRVQDTHITEGMNKAINKLYKQKILIDATDVDEDGVHFVAKSIAGNFTSIERARIACEVIAKLGSTIASDILLDWWD